MKNFLFIFFLFVSFITKANTINIGIFNNLHCTSIMLTPSSSSYFIIVDNTKKITVTNESLFQLSVMNDSIRLRSMENDYGNFFSIQFIGDDSSSMRMRCLNPRQRGHQYQNNFTITIQNHELKIVNQVDLENYVAGVVEAEVGNKQSVEYYKVQAIICRTYALSNLRRHEEENFNLCDNVHCQVYRGNNKINPAIEAATFQTKNLVLVDKKSELITTAFHSNCGGETCNSEDVWGLQKPYLRSVKDTFCIHQRNAQWTKRISLSEWNNYLSQSCKPCAADSAKLCCDFTQTQRKNFFDVSNAQFFPKNIRNDFKLKSSFFSIQQQNDSILFVGKGYGHGVGLCQEGAMQMAKSGYTYQSILHFYYQQIDIINLNQLQFFKE